jgi:hypothetical protein
MDVYYLVLGPSTTDMKEWIHTLSTGNNQQHLLLDNRRQEACGSSTTLLLLSDKLACPMVLYGQVQGRRRQIDCRVCSDYTTISLFVSFSN